MSNLCNGILLTRAAIVGLVAGALFATSPAIAQSLGYASSSNQQFSLFGQIIPNEARVEKRPETAEAPTYLRRHIVAYNTREDARDRHRRHPKHATLLRARGRQGDQLRYRCWARRLYLVWSAGDSAQGRMARLDPAGGDDPASTVFAAVYGRRPRQSARRSCSLSRQHRLSHPRYQCAGDDRQTRIQRMHPDGERRCDRSLRPRRNRHQGHRIAGPAARDHASRRGPTGNCRQGAPSSPSLRIVLSINRMQRNANQVTLSPSPRPGSRAAGSSPGASRTFFDFVWRCRRPIAPKPKS